MQNYLKSWILPVIIQRAPKQANISQKYLFKKYKKLFLVVFENSLFFFLLKYIYKIVELINIINPTEIVNIQANVFWFIETPQSFIMIL